MILKFVYEFIIINNPFIIFHFIVSCTACLLFFIPLLLCSSWKYISCYLTMSLVRGGGNIWSCVAHCLAVFLVETVSYQRGKDSDG